MGLTQRLGLSRYQADEFYAEALEHYQNEDYKAAIEAISQAITLLPLNSEYHAARGLFHMEDGDTDAARENYQHALKLHEGEVLANYGMGVLSFNAKQWEESRAWFHKARAVNPMQAETPYYIAITYHREQDNATAKTYMELALELLEAADDKRRVAARRWIREFESLIKQAQFDTPEPAPKQATLPLLDSDKAPLSREELTDTVRRSQLTAALSRDEESDAEG